MTHAEPGGPPTEPGHRLLELVAVMDRLRSPGGCPWDAEQTHRSLVEYLVEETYETVEAIETDDRAALREELGDLLLQVVFHSRIAQEDPDSPFTVDDVAEGIVTKLVARHPHVFGDVDAHTAEMVEATWFAAKSREKGRTSVTDGVPLALPSLVLAAKLLTRAQHGGVDVAPAPPSALSVAREVVDGVADEDAFGDVLLALVALGRDRGWDADTAARGAARRLRTALRAVEADRAG